MPLLLHEHLLCGLLAVGSHLHDVHALGKIGVLHLRTSEVVHLQAVVLAANVHLSVAYEDANTLLSLGAVHVGRLDEARLLVRLAQTRLAAVVDSVLVHRQRLQEERCFYAARWLLAEQPLEPSRNAF